MASNLNGCGSRISCSAGMTHLPCEPALAVCRFADRRFAEDLEATSPSTTMALIPWQRPATRRKVVFRLQTRADRSRILTDWMPPGEGGVRTDHKSSATSVHVRSLSRVIRRSNSDRCATSTTIFLIA
jgi:hypothetical protein